MPDELWTEVCDIVQEAVIKGKREFSSCQADRAMKQATHNVKIIFKLSVVECGVLFSVIALTAGDRASKKQVHH